MAAGSFGAVELGLFGIGLNTALADVTINSSQDFSAWMTPAALAGGPTGTIHLGGVDTDVTLNNSAGGVAAYAKLIVDSGGGAGNALVLNASTPEIDIAAPTAPATTTEALVISGEAMDIANLHTFNGSAATGDLAVIFNSFGTVAATGGSGDDTFVFSSDGGLSTFTGSGSTVDGMGGTNTLIIWADTGTILAAGDAAGITNIATIVNNTDAGGATGALSRRPDGDGSCHDVRP